jgi:hypothetical protein
MNDNGAITMVVSVGVAGGGGGTTVAGETTRPRVPDTPLIVALTVTVPAATAVSIPELLTVAIALFELCHVTSEVSVWVLLSE